MKKYIILILAFLAFHQHVHAQAAALVYRDSCKCEVHFRPVFLAGHDESYGGKYDNYFPEFTPCCIITNYLFKIYNRWGQEMLNTRDPKEEWDAVREPDGVYFYLLEYKVAADTALLTVTGNVALIR